MNNFGHCLPYEYKNHVDQIYTHLHQVKYFNGSKRYGYGCWQNTKHNISLEGTSRVGIHNWQTYSIVSPDFLIVSTSLWPTSKPGIYWNSTRIDPLADHNEFCVNTAITVEYLGDLEELESIAMLLYLEN